LGARSTPGGAEMAESGILGKRERSEHENFNFSSLKVGQHASDLRVQGVQNFVLHPCTTINHNICTLFTFKEICLRAGSTTVPDLRCGAEFRAVLDLSALIKRQPSTREQSFQGTKVVVFDALRCAQLSLAVQGRFQKVTLYLSTSKPGKKATSHTQTLRCRQPHVRAGRGKYRRPRLGSH
jgi:hypothetical protein